MDILNWAEQECRIACKKENQSYDFDSDDFDYGCSCYKSALKAYKSLCEDGHSGFSFNATKNILMKLMDGQPLTPITDKDFFPLNDDTGRCLMTNNCLNTHGLKSSIQCPRMSSLFRDETLDGKVTYHDIDRYYHVNIEDNSDTYHSKADFLDKMFPIKMPYVPKRGKYKIYEQTFLVDKKNGDFDTKGIFYIITPEGEKIDICIYKTTDENGKWKDITKAEYEELLARRLDPLNKKVASSLIWSLISNTGTEEEIDKKERLYKLIPQEIKDKWFDDMDELCKFFETPDHYQYNNFNYRQALCYGNEEKYSDIPELVKIASYLKYILTTVMNYKEGNEVHEE